MDKVIERLKSYPKLIQKCNILRYELEDPTVVSDEEVPEAMNFLKWSGGIPHGGVSNKTLYIGTITKQRSVLTPKPEMTFWSVCCLWRMRSAGSNTM